MTYMGTAPSLAAAAEQYRLHGFAIVKLYDETQVARIHDFATTWVHGLLAEWTSGQEQSFPLAEYHIWSKSMPLEHGRIFQARNRHTNANDEIRDILLNDKLQSFLEHIGVDAYRVWDEGLGWLAFRFIRPSSGDGYPTSRKAWGVATNVISCWIPVIGHTPKETLSLVPGSHVKKYDRYLPTDEKFCKGEYRLAPSSGEMQNYRPALSNGDAVLFHPKTLHSEEISGGTTTRLSLEFRIVPLSPVTGQAGVPVENTGQD